MASVASSRPTAASSAGVAGPSSPCPPPSMISRRSSAPPRFSDCNRSIRPDGSGLVSRAISSTTAVRWSASQGTPTKIRCRTTSWAASQRRNWSAGTPAEPSNSATFSGTTITLAGSRLGRPRSYWARASRASCPTRPPICRPASRLPSLPITWPISSGVAPASGRRASVSRRAPGSTSGASSPRMASAQSGRLTGWAVRVNPRPARLVTGSTQSSARRRRSSHSARSLGGGAGAGRGSAGVAPNASAPTAVATATCLASSQLTGPDSLASSLANSRNRGMRPKKSAPPENSLMAPA
jgi:hypothetical protein